MFTCHEQGIGYIILNNKSNCKFTSELSFTKGDETIDTAIGIKPIKPDTLDYVLELAPGQTIIKCLLVDPEGINYSMSESCSYMEVRK